MSDVIDRASEQEEYLRELALNKRVPLPTKPSQAFCEDCGMPIKKARCDAVQGCATCVDCQELRELQND